MLIFTKKKKIMEYFGYGSDKKESPTSARKKWGNAQVAATLRISESMTI